MVGRGRRLKRTTLIGLLCGGILAGVALGRVVHLPFSVGVVSGLVCALVLRRRDYILALALVIFGISIGLVRAGIFIKQARLYDVLNGTKVAVRATVLGESVYADKGQIEFETGTLVLQDGTKLPGKITVRGYGVPMVYRGDGVVVEGKLYKTRGSKQASMSFSNIRRVYKHKSALETIRRKFNTVVISVLPEPLGSLALGLLVGQRNNLPDSFSDSLSRVGLTHIIAVSGYNLTIIVSFVRRLLKDRSKYQATVGAITLVGLFLMVTGSSASIVRASLVSLLSLWAWYYGRSIKPVVLLLVAACLTGAWNPLYVWSDVGWYLSFLAFTGVLVIAPILTERFFRRQPKLIGQTIIETMSAQLMTMPLIMYVFGRVSIVALIANLMVVPLVPLAMLCSVIVGVMGFVSPVLAGFASVPARLLLTYMRDVVSVLAGLPFAEVRVSLELWHLLAGYTLCILILMTMRRKSVKISV